MGVQGWDLGELVYLIAAILFWCGVIVGFIALMIWSLITVVRDSDFSYSDSNPPCPPYGDAASGHSTMGPHQ